MFEEIIIMAGFVVFSVVLSYVLLEYTPSPMDKLVKGFVMVGIVFHELCHIFMCFITNTKIKSVNLLKKRDNTDFNARSKYFGSVEPEKQPSFLQALLVGFAPVLFSFWLFFFLLFQLLNEPLTETVGFIYVLLMISISLSAAPSVADMISVIGSFSYDWRHSFYQLFLLALSIGTVWYGSNNIQYEAFYEIVLYASIFLVYFGYFYLFRGIRVVYRYFFIKKKINLKKLHRKQRWNPKKPPRSERKFW